MLEYMRKNANSTVVWVIIGAIALVFVFFGIGGGGGGYKFITVNGQEISPYEYDNMVNSISRQQGGDLGPEQMQEIRKSAVGYLVGELLARQFGENVGLGPTDQAVARNIASLPDFQTDGRFDTAKYEAAFANRRGRSGKEAFEESVRREIMMDRVGTLFSGLAGTYEPELFERYRFQEDKAAFDYSFFPAEKHRAGLVPSEEALKVYYALNQERWRTPAEMKIEYVEIRPGDFMDKVTVNEDDLREAYNEYPERFAVKESAEASHILFRFPSTNPAPEEKAAVLEKARAVYERAQAEDFAALAREVSEDPGSASEGGALGSLGRGMTLPGFEEALFSAEIGRVTEPVESALGYHLIKVTARQEDGIRPFEAVKGELETEFKNIRAREAALGEMENLLIRTETNPQFRAAAESMNLVVKATEESFTPQTAPAFFEDDQEAVEQAFKAPVGRVAPPLEKDELFVIYSPLERRDSAIPPLSEMRAEVAEAWVTDKAAALARAEAEEFLKKAQSEGWDAALAARGEEAKTGRSSLASRRALLNTDPELTGMDPMTFLAAACSVALPEQISPLAVYVDNPALGGPGALALRLAEVKPADEAEFTGMLKETFSYILAVDKNKILFSVWNNGLFKASESGIKVPAAYTN